MFWPAVAPSRVPRQETDSGASAVPRLPLPARRARLPLVWICGSEVPALRMLPGAVMLASPAPAPTWPIVRSGMVLWTRTSLAWALKVPVAATNSGADWSRWRPVRTKPAGCLPKGTVTGLPPTVPVRSTEPGAVGAARVEGHVAPGDVREGGADRGGPGNRGQARLGDRVAQHGLRPHGVVRQCGDLVVGRRVLESR